ncbi:MAG: AraC family transcriptional regulator [Blautia sp.]|nr:AraC family transcriptional regulator [Blautia sp.]
MEDFVFQRYTKSRFQDLHLQFCDYEKCDPLHGFGPAVRPDYIIHFVLEGKGIYQVKDRTWTLEAGDGFLIEPEVLTFYQADAMEPWTYFWICFNGDLAEELLGNLGLGDDRLTFRCKRKDELKQVILEMLKNHTFSVENDFFLQSQLYLFFSILLKDVEDAAPAQRNRENDYVRTAIEFIQNNYFSAIQVTDIAAYVGINRSYLYTLFHSELGISPQKFLSDFRLSRAENLLSSTELSIENISVSCGYQNPLVFSKAFKKRFQITPLKYRQKERTYNLSKLKANKEKLDEL